MVPIIAMLLALSGWEGKVHFQHNPPRKSGGSEGAIHFAAGRVRLEEPTPIGLTVILWDGRRLVLLFPAKKTWVELPPKDAPMTTAPPLSLAGLYNSGTEVIDGKPCTIWQQKRQGVTQRVWVPDPPPRKKNFFLFLREVTISPRGATEADVSDVRFKDQPASLFRVPKGYQLTSR
ncbi:MAG TPA: hypothetical protein VLW85_14090 [Myxococcales bacterium]|nr:hypothetical protein [Myxococcales bacterium]